ncbi:hypothetical protein B0T20DRAFT_173142 [Sordaria brevicollis]|uniref:Azaphilone pigments biosynthesis cluster protein L N-terminal domain-containing protein n=1 Tax=Sordaria brevicollis TaxID=83679 RepID=A0AAE0UDB1_SORBR|nr:hypothetical protein B0T20DRAFT_173142 [Sordaria brevicollis]
MDVVSVASGVCALAGGATTCAMTVANFIREVKFANKDLEIVSSELRTMAIVLTLLNEALNRIRTRNDHSLPEEILKQLNVPVKECGSLVTDIEAYLKGFKSDILRRVSGPCTVTRTLRSGGIACRPIRGPSP